MDVILVPLIMLIRAVSNMIIWAVIIQAILSWLIIFGIVNVYSNFIASISEALSRITSPLLDPIRQKIPPAGGIDLSPVVLILAISFVCSVIERVILKFI